MKGKPKTVVIYNVMLLRRCVRTFLLRFVLSGVLLADSSHSLINITFGMMPFFVSFVYM